MTRRQLLVTLAAAIGLAARPYAFGMTPAQVEHPRSAEDWMDDWMKASRAPDGVLRLSRFVEPIYFLTDPIGWKPEPGEKLPSVTVPKGFVTDLASIPTVFYSLLRPDGEYAYAAIVHDYLYWTQTHPRAIADSILKRGMEDFQVAGWKVLAIYEAVRAGGGSSWNENARLKKHGERRVLKKFPADPRTKWSDWKQLPNVFI